MVTVRVEGPDAEEVAAILKIPTLDEGGFGWSGVPRAAALLRQLRVKALQAELGYEVEVRWEGSDGEGPLVEGDAE